MSANQSFVMLMGFDFWLVPEIHEKKTSAKTFTCAATTYVVHAFNRASFG